MNIDKLRGPITTYFNGFDSLRNQLGLNEPGYPKYSYPDGIYESLALSSGEYLSYFNEIGYWATHEVRVNGQSASGLANRLSGPIVGQMGWHGVDTGKPEENISYLPDHTQV